MEYTLQPVTDSLDYSQFPLYADSTEKKKEIKMKSLWRAEMSK